MTSLRTSSAALAAALLVPLAACGVSRSPDPLPSWNASSSRAALVQFVARVTSPGPDFVAPDDRIAVFDNDGTLWAEQPVYTQLAFAIDRVRVLAPAHPEWRTQEPFASLLKGDLAGALANGEPGLARIVMATHAGMTTAEFDTIVREWVAVARHPQTTRLYTEMVYQPMLELLAYLRAHDFQTYIVSGGGVEFMRPWTERVYGIPPEQVIGSSIKTQLDHRGGVPVLVRLPELNFLDDREGKPVAIHQYIGRRPVMAVGNSDGDLQMLEWTAAGQGPRLAVLVHHTDGDREWAYDRSSKVGRLDRALDEAKARSWTVVDMKRDWAVIYPQAR